MTSTYILAGLLWGIYCIRMQLILKKIEFNFDHLFWLWLNFVLWPISMIIAIIGIKESLNKWKNNERDKNY